MNIFIIPSWYPSQSNPIYGIFNKEQARLMGQTMPSWNVGVSRWGQGDKAFLLPVKHPLSIIKLFKKHSSGQNNIVPNVKEYFSPAFTWTRKWNKGNIEGIIKATEENFNAFVYDYGRPDVISAQATYPAAIVANRMAHKFNIPFTVTIRMSPFPFSEFLTKEGTLSDMISESLSMANRLIATSQSLKMRLAEFGLENVSVVNNPIDVEKFKPIETKKSISGNHRILTVGRIENQKGIDLLLKAASKIDAPFELRIGGKGTQGVSYKALARKLGINNKTTWLGELTRQEVIEEMQNCSFYVLSSRHETFGNVVVEAMSCGKPVVATKCGGPEEIVTNETGYLAEINVEDLAEKVAMMIRNQSSFDPKVIRESVLCRYSPQVWIRNLENLFREII